MHNANATRIGVTYGVFRPTSMKRVWCLPSFFGRLVKVKVKVNCTLVQALRLCTGRTAHRGSRGITLSFHDRGTRRRWGGQCRAPAALYPRERPGTHCTGGWMVLRAGLDRCGISRLPPGFDPLTVHPVASRYTYYATRPTYVVIIIFNLVCFVRLFIFRHQYLIVCNKTTW